jgi:hypothetical protein
LDKFRCKGDMLVVRRSALTLTNKLPRVNLFLMPFVQLFELVCSTISAKMEINIEMLRDNTFKLTDGESH